MTRTPPARTRRAAGTLLAVVLAGVAWSSLAAGTARAADPDGPDLTVTIPERGPSDPDPVPGPTPSTTSPATTPGTVPPATTTKPGTSTRGGGTGADPDAAPAGDPAPCVPTEPAVPTAPEQAGEPVVTDRPVYLPGQQVTVTAAGFPAGEQVQLVLFADPAVVGTFTADGAGEVEAVVPVADGTAAGRVTVQLSGWCTGVALGDVLVGSAGSDDAGTQGVPAWAWWAGGGMGLTGAGVGGWWLLRAMRAPVAALAPVVLR
jgi:hypothetical protein